MGLVSIGLMEGKESTHSLCFGFSLCHLTSLTITVSTAQKGSSMDGPFVMSCGIQAEFKQKLSFLKHILCARHCSESLTCFFFKKKIKYIFIDLRALGKASCRRRLLVGTEEERKRQRLIHGDSVTRGKGAFTPF